MVGEELERLREENKKLREENKILLEIVVQMKETLNRLVTRYISGQD